jgi:hypothetical protein
MDMLNSEVACNILANSFPYYSGRANPPNLSSTAFIDTAASKSLVPPSTQTSPAASLESITIIQQGGDKMRTIHAVNLLLSKLPPNARMSHSFPSLTNNLLSVAVLCDAGCEVFFNATSCKVTFDSEVILQGWHDPNHRHWRICIVDDGWMTNLKINETTSPHLKLLPSRTLSTIATICNN